jgi:hypothetical protein
MQPGSLLLVSASQSFSQDWRAPRERRHGGRRRAEDATPTADLGAGPSLNFLTQVVSQVRPDPAAPDHPYETKHRWRCGVCADEIA